MKNGCGCSSKCGTIKRNNCTCIEACECWVSKCSCGDACGCPKECGCMEVVCDAAPSDCKCC